MNTVSSFQVEIQSVSKSFMGKQALCQLNLDFLPGKMHGVIGPEGAGKTTLFRLMAGLLRVDSGQILFKKEGKILDFEQVRPKMAYMPERPCLYADLSISEHLDFFSALYGLTSTDYHAIRQRLLKITRLEEFVDRPAGKLSGGMYKKLGLMCSLLRSPEILLLDEPTNGVDPISRREFWDLLYQLREQKVLIMISTAYMDEAERCDNAHLLQSGKVLATGAPQELIQKENVKSISDLFIKKAQKEIAGEPNG
ncbi:MAG: ABC transporter ATP-binding protein [Pseudomonadota bacterium]